MTPEINNTVTRASRSHCVFEHSVLIIVLIWFVLCFLLNCCQSLKEVMTVLCLMWLKWHWDCQPKSDFFLAHSDGEIRWSFYSHKSQGIWFFRGCNNLQEVVSNCIWTDMSHREQLQTHPWRLWSHSVWCNTQPSRAGWHADMWSCNLMEQTETGETSSVQRWTLIG